ncbi:MAG: DUF5127 domain-containing protein, partial [Bacteroidetes bacterium]
MVKAKTGRPGCYADGYRCPGCPEKSGDDLRIDWGYLYVVSPSDQGISNVIRGAEISRKSFLKNDRVLPDDDLRMPRPANDDWPVMASVFSFDSLAAPAERFI